MEFLKSQKRFRFLLDGQDAWSLPYQQTACETADTLTVTYTFESGLQITNTARKYSDFGAYEWVNTIQNAGTAPTGVISALWDCDCVMSIPHEDPKATSAYIPDRADATKIYAPTGSICSKQDFICDADRMEGGCRLNHLYPGSTAVYAPFGGRSSDRQAPFFNVHKTGCGYVFAVGWTGQWRAEISRTEDTLRFRSKVEDTAFRVLPGECFRTSSVVILPYTGDVARAQNQWRRLLKTHFTPIGRPRRPSQAPLSAGMWGGMSSSAILQRVETIRKEGLPFEYVWMDAGWYGIETAPTLNEFEGDWSERTGDWRISPHCHPGGLTDVSRAIHQAGLKFLLWFEPERAIKHTPAVLEHPDYFLTDDPDSPHRILNLGEPAAWEYIYRTVCDLIERLQVDAYRQDFNLPVLPFWRKHDTLERIGITEIKHINGLYRLWDELLMRFPHLLIDNCASGGRRLDIETMRRSVPLWRSDFQCAANYDIEASQCHHLSYASWMPYSGTGSGRGYDLYRIRSAYDAGMTTNHFWSETDPFGEHPEQVAFLKRYLTEYLRIRPYFSEDVYPLTEPCDRTDVWCAVQFHRPSGDDGIVQVFRREEAPYETAVFLLKDLDPDSNYQFEDLDGGQFTASGQELMKTGLKLTLPHKRTAKIYLYKKG